MKKALIALALGVTLLLGTAAPVQAAPRFGFRYSAIHGYIVWVRGDASPSRYRCTWYTGNNTRPWVFAHYLGAGEYQWTTSDAGNWGNGRPQNLDCNYRRA